MVELRKRKAPAAPPPPAKKSRTPATSRAKPVDEGTKAVEASPAKKAPQVGDIIALEGFGGEIETNDGETTTLKALVDASKSGVVLFTYPKASTPGCTKQACSFRDNHEYLTSTGLSIYGLSADSPKANTAFKTKQKLPYPLLCDTKVTLIGALGLKKAPKGTTRGVFAIDKQGKVLILQAGGPDATVDAVQQLVSEQSKGSKTEDNSKEAEPELSNVSEGKQE